MQGRFCFGRGGREREKIGEGCRERTEEMAKKAIMMKAILWNMAVLMVSGFLLFRWWVLEGAY